ncbi:hypothetical protein LB577_17735 [Mesorhizobium sp. B283B1A]|nr:hypothetical protein [Mesorhizobium opportunistum]MCA0048766.1 hypothetical protein [Mesorhizobium sp. B283B1A]UQS67094.1 hypothetical protein M5D98_12515 [Mesorhizobium opportunistum]
MTRIASLLASGFMMVLPLSFASLSSASATMPEAATALFKAKTVAARDGALSTLEAAAPKDPASAYAAGAGEFFTALELLATGLHRHGFESPQSFMLPLMQLPVPTNPNPEPLTYEQFRAILLAFRDRLEKSAATLGSVHAEADIGMVIDLTHVGIDLNEDSTIAPDESMAAIMAALSHGGVSQGDAAPTLTFRFDRADGYWLQGYAEFLMAQADFWLAHDFKGHFRRLIPHAVPARQAAAAGYSRAPAQRDGLEHLLLGMAHRRFHLDGAHDQLAGGRAGAPQGGAPGVARNDPAVARGLEGDPRRERQ